MKFAGGHKIGHSTLVNCRSRIGVLSGISPCKPLNSHTLKRARVHLVEQRCEGSVASTTIALAGWEQMSSICKSVLEMPGRPNGYSEQHLFHPGGLIRESGIYLVHHSDHRTCHEVTLLRNEVFPRCTQCGDAVSFELVRNCPDLDHHDFRVRLYSIPHLEQQAA